MKSCPWSTIVLHSLRVCNILGDLRSHVCSRGRDAGRKRQGFRKQGVLLKTIQPGFGFSSGQLADRSSHRAPHACQAVCDSVEPVAASRCGFNFHVSNY